MYQICILHSNLPFPFLFVRHASLFGRSASNGGLEREEECGEALVAASEHSQSQHEARATYHLACWSRLPRTAAGGVLGSELQCGRGLGLGLPTNRPKQQSRSMAGALAGARFIIDSAFDIQGRYRHTRLQPHRKPPCARTYMQAR